MNIFVTSNGINSGKTVFSAGIAAVMQSLGYEIGIYKPIQTGCKYANNKQFAPDLNFVKQIDPNIKTYSTYNYKENTIPAIAADKERIKFSLENIIRDFNAAKRENDITIVEGSGGLMTPVTSRFCIADLVMNLKLPIIIVANIEKDFVNKTLLSLKIAELYKLDVLGVVLNNYSKSKDSNDFHEEILLLENIIDCPILGNLPNLNIEGEGINPENLISEVLQHINLPMVFNMEIPKLFF